MADMDAEAAFLNAQEADGYGSYSNGNVADQPQVASDEEDDYDPSNLMPETSYPVAKSPSEQSSASISESTAQSPPTTADSASLKPKPAEASASTKQPRTMGGFVVESEDEEEEIPVSRPKAVGSASLNVNQGSSVTPQRSLSQTPNNTLPPSNVSLHSAAPQELGLSGVLPTDVPTIASVSNAATPVQESTKSPQVSHINSAVSAANSSLPRARLPNDRVGIFEDRIAEDPRGDMDAWLSLISEHRQRHKFNEARAVYDRFLKVFPSAAEEWINYANMETELEALMNVERIFERSITSNCHIGLWSIYVDYIRRRNNLTIDQTGQARGIVDAVYRFVLDNVGIDREAGKLWTDYIEFLKSGPGTVGGSTWQDMQKMDTLRKIYQRAIQVPTHAVQAIWKQYDQFEMGLNKVTGRKYLQEKSPGYMTARSANVALENITKGLIRTTRPKLPPAIGFDGDTEYMTQVELWRKWINWEKEDPLVIKDEPYEPLSQQPTGFKPTNAQKPYNARILYVYKQALMALRFWPEMWYEAAEFCFENDMEKEGMEFLTNGIEANPENCLLAFKKADRIELKGEFEEGEEGVIRKGEAVREPFNRALDALYDLINQTMKREEYSIARVKEAAAQREASAEPSDNEDQEGSTSGANAKRTALDNQINAMRAGFNAQILQLKKTISYAWIALMRAMRRIQGKGRPDANPPGFRGIFAEARRKGKLLSDAYVASALIEHHCYKDPAATRIFDRGMKLFPDDENFALEYIKHLININDTTNARAVFETVVNRLTQKPESIPRAKALFSFLHEYESKFGELSQITNLEKRMSDLFPEDPQLARFSHRFSVPKFDPTSTRPVISPATQMRPKLLVVPSIEEPQQPLPQQKLPSPPPQYSPRPVPASLLPVSNSPKRPFDESDSELAQPRKMARGESPLKGAAGRRLDAARRNLARASEGASHTNIPQAAPPQPLPRDINFLLGIIPGAHTYKETRFSAEAMVALLRNTDLNRANPTQQQQQQQRQPPMAMPQVGWPGMPQMPGPMGGYGYQR